MRYDQTAAILLPEYESYLNEAYKLRYYKAAFDVHDFLIKDYFRDNQRPLTKWLVKPIVVILSQSENSKE